MLDGIENGAIADKLETWRIISTFCRVSAKNTISDSVSPESASHRTDKVKLIRDPSRSLDHRHCGGLETTGFFQETDRSRVDGLQKCLFLHEPPPLVELKRPTLEWKKWIYAYKLCECEKDDLIVGPVFSLRDDEAVSEHDDDETMGKYRKNNNIRDRFLLRIAAKLRSCSKLLLPFRLNSFMLSPPSSHV